MACEIQCRITTGHLAVEKGELRAAAEQLVEAEDLLQRAIECGALIDPWNILGFQGQFSLFPAPENSGPDLAIRTEWIDHNLDDILETNGRRVQIAESSEPDFLPLFLGASDRGSERLLLQD